MQKIIPTIIFLSFLTLSYGSYAQETKQMPQVNYVFSLKTLDDFFPGKNLDDIQGKYKQTVLLKKEKGLYRTYVKHDRYKFPVFFKVKEKVVLIFFARMPTFFLHDLFHKDLIQRYGKQDKYTKAHLSALYEWDNENDFNIIYKAQCTNTCFPAYITVKKTGAKENILKEI